MIEVAQRTLDAAAAVEMWTSVEAVRRPLWEHYLRKCYLCERFIDCSDFEVDHRVPQHVCEVLARCRFNWFPACRSCNGRRGRFPHPGGLLSPGLDRAIETRMQQRIERVDSTEVRARFSASDPEDLYAVNTASELERLHSPDSGTTENARARARELLDDIEDHYVSNIYPLEIKALRARRRGHPDERTERDLCRALARTEPFTMLVHSMVDPKLGDLLDRALAAERP